MLNNTSILSVLFLALLKVGFFGKGLTEAEDIKKRWQEYKRRQVLGPGALGRPRGIGWKVRWKGGSGWGIHVYPWLIHVYV